VKSEQHDDSQWAGGLETQSETRQQINEEPADVHYPMVHEFDRENIPVLPQSKRHRYNIILSIELTYIRYSYILERRERLMIT